MVLFLKIFIVLAYAAMLAINGLANALPLNGQTTGEVSGKYPTLFTPAGFTFSIWGIIYIVLAIYVFKMLMTPEADFVGSIRVASLLFMLSSLFNIGWLFAWHYEKIGLSTIVIALLLVTLLVITVILKDQANFLRGTFSLYAGWVSVALIANIAIWLVSKGVAPFSTTSLIFTILVLITGVVIAGVVVWFLGDIIYLSVFIWAYGGILLRHLAQTDLPRTYPSMIITLSVSLLMLSVMVLISLVERGGNIYA